MAANCVGKGRHWVREVMVAKGTVKKGGGMMLWDSSKHNS